VLTKGEPGKEILHLRPRSSSSAGSSPALLLDFFVTPLSSSFSQVRRCGWRK
jgi:hypothetical protein